MTIDNKVVWTEGMFLRVQHFQQFDRYVERLVRGRAGDLRPAAWGISELQIDHGQLSVGKLDVLRCRGTLPDGTPFSIPEADEPPTPLDLPEGIAGVVVNLALPLRRPGGAEYESGGAPSGDATPRYRTGEIDVFDAAAGSSSAARITVGRLAFRLLPETQEQQGYTGIGLARIAEVGADRRATLDDSYIPPCLDIAATPHIGGFLSEVLGLVRYRADALAARITSGGAARGVIEGADLMLLQTLNRAEPLLTHYGRMAVIHPDCVYRSLVALAGELASFTAPNRRAVEFPAYRHTDLLRTFEPVMIELRRSLSTILTPTAVQIPLEEKRYGARRGRIQDRSLCSSAVFVLAVRADVPEDGLLRTFPSLVKIGPEHQIRELVNSALPGIGVRHMAQIPRQVPFQNGAIYFELDRTGPLWAAVAATGDLVIHAAGNFPGLQMELWAARS